MNRTRLLLLLAFLAAACRGPQSEWSSQELPIDASFEGNQAFTDEQLSEVVRLELETLDGRAVDKAAVDDSAYALELFYRGKGFPDVTVDYDFAPADRGRATFLVDEGAQALVASFDVEGVTSLGQEQLAELLSKSAPGKRFSLAAARRAMTALRSAYLALGHLEVRVEGPVAERLEDGSVALSATVYEGPRFVLQRMEVEGQLPALDQFASRLIRNNLGITYTPHVAFRLRSNMTQRHVRAGFPDCEVEVEEQLDPETGHVHLILKVETGPRVKIAAVEVVGNEDIDADRIRGRVQLEPGDTFDPKKIEESFRLLYATGLFDSVRMYLKEDTGEQRTLVTEVVESPTLELFAEPGWGSYVGPFLNLGVDERNLFGSGKRARLQGHVSRLDNGIQLLLSDPWLFDAAIVGEGSVFWNDRIEPSFSYSEVGFNLGVRKDWTQHFSTSLGYELSFTETRDVQIGGVIPPNIADDVDIGSVTFSLVRSTRDHLILPTKGSLVRFYSNFATSALGSEVNLFENGVDLSRVFPLSKETQLAGSARVSVVAPFGETANVPLTRRLFNGGENTVRSFKQSQLGPKDINGEPIGGEARNIFSVEVRHRLKGNFTGAAFFDTGNVILDYSDYFDFDDFRSGIGVGIRYLLPIGPLRLDYAINPDPRPGEEDWVLHFAVGLAY